MILELKTEVAGSISVAEGSHGSATDCTFTNNGALKRAGAIYIEDHSAFTLQRSLITSKSPYKRDQHLCWGLYFNEDCTLGNKAEYAGSLRVQGSSNATVEGCTFTENLAIKRGGAIFVDEQSLLNLLKTTLTSKTLDPGIFRLLTSERCVSDNKAENGGSLYMSESSRAIIKDSSFTNHSALKRGGVIYVDMHSTLNLFSTVLASKDLILKPKFCVHF